MPNSWAGSIGGVNFVERPGSNQITYTDSDVQATRVFVIRWQDRQSFVNALTNTPFTRNDGTSFLDYAYPEWPGTFANGNSYQTNLVVKQIDIEPEWGGKQSGIDTDTNNDNIVKYDYALVTVTYGLEKQDRRTAQWHTTLTSRITKGGGYVWVDSSEAVPGVETLETAEEITLTLRVSELNLNNPLEAAIANLSSPKIQQMTINTSAIYFQNGRGNVLYPAKTLLFANWDINDTFRFGKIDTEIVYSFIVSPAYSANSNYNWEYQWDNTPPAGWGQILPAPYPFEISGTYNGWQGLVPWDFRSPA